MSVLFTALAVLGIAAVAVFLLASTAMVVVSAFAADIFDVEID